MTYYVWAGVGAIEDLDGEDHPPVENRFDAIALFVVLAQQREGDLTLWEREGNKAVLVAAKQTGSVFMVNHGQFCVSVLK